MGTSISVAESCTAGGIAATKSGGTSLPRGEENFPSCKFGRVARALWPRKTAVHLAAAAGVSDRHAKNWLSGEHEPSARAVAAVIAEMLG